MFDRAISEEEVGHVLQTLNLPSCLSKLVHEYLGIVEMFVYGKTSSNNKDYLEIFAFIPGVCMGKKISLYDIWHEGITKVSDGLYKNGVYRIICQGKPFVWSSTNMSITMPTIGIIDMNASDISKFKYSLVSQSMAPNIYFIKQYDFNHIITVETGIQRGHAFVVIYNVEKQYRKMIASLTMKEECYKYSRLIGSSLHIFLYSSAGNMDHLEICLQTGNVTQASISSKPCENFDHDQDIFDMDGKIIIWAPLSYYRPGFHFYMNIFDFSSVNKDKTNKSKIKMFKLPQELRAPSYDCKIQYISNHLFCISDKEYWITKFSTNPEQELTWSKFSYSDRMTTLSLISFTNESDDGGEGFHSFQCTIC